MAVVRSRDNYQGDLQMIWAKGCCNRCMMHDTVSVHVLLTLVEIWILLGCATQVVMLPMLGPHQTAQHMQQTAEAVQLLLQKLLATRKLPHGSHALLACLLHIQLWHTASSLPTSKPSAFAQNHRASLVCCRM